VGLGKLARIYQRGAECTNLRGAWDFISCAHSPTWGLLHIRFYQRGACALLLTTSSSTL